MMKELQKHTFNVFKNVEDILTDLLGAAGKKIFINETKFSKYARLPYDADNRNATMRWMKSIDPMAEEIEGIPCALRVTNDIAWGAHLRFYLGDYYLQTLASMLPALVLDPGPEETILDIAAAPGSKTTQIAEMMSNTGRLVANDSDYKRVLKLIYNLDRMGIYNTALTNIRGEQFGKLLPEFFDRVLVDAPCSSIGAPEKWSAVDGWIKPGKIRSLVTTQANLLHSAYKAVKPGGVLVYSTCTLNPMENEGVVDWALKNLGVEIEVINEDFGLKRTEPLTEWKGIRFNPDVRKAFKILPIDNPTEGFFIARLRKTSVSKERAQTELISYRVMGKKDRKQLFSQYEIDELTLGPNGFKSGESKIWMFSEAWKSGHLPFAIRTGQKIGEQRDRGVWRFSQSGAQQFGAFANQKRIELGEKQWVDLMQKRKLRGEWEEGYYILYWNNRAVTYGYVEKGRLNIKIGRPYALSFDSSKINS